MFRSKKLACSVISFLALCAVTALFYLVTGAFGGDDVESATRFFGAVQLVLLVFVLFFMIKIADFERLVYRCLYYASFTLLLVIQFAPASLWIAYNGKAHVPGTMEGLGITANWIYGAFHIAIIIWGFFNMIAFHASHRARA